MPFNHRSLIFAVCLAGLIPACSSPKERSGAAWNLVQPRPPNRGEPVNIMEVARYLEVESLKLLAQGRVATNLLQQPRPATCSLKLAQPPTRTLASDELAGAVEMGVAVVGRLAKVSGRPQLTPTASGFFLTESGALATCWHVVNWNKLIGLTVMTRDGRVCPVQRVLAVSTNYDLAILQVEGTGFTPLPVAANVRQGAPVWVLGHPFPWFYMLTAGVASGYYTLGSAKTDITLLDITADFANGSSGAPVFNESGAVVGIAATRQTLGIPGTPQMAVKGCLPSSAILNLAKP
jgi:serine protease Do